MSDGLAGPIYESLVDVAGTSASRSGYSGSFLFPRGDPWLHGLGVLFDVFRIFAKMR